MKYMMIIHHGTALDGLDRLSDEEKGAFYGGWAALNATPGVTPGVRMDGPETATTVRADGGSALVTDGPFAELKDAIGGYFFYEGADLDAAIAVAAAVPSTARGGAVEIRPLVEDDGKS